MVTNILYPLEEKLPFLEKAVYLHFFLPLLLHVLFLFLLYEINVIEQRWLINDKCSKKKSVQLSVLYTNTRLKPLIHLAGLCIQS